jgi:hypothetical protein
VLYVDIRWVDDKHVRIHQIYRPTGEGWYSQAVWSKGLWNLERVNAGVESYRFP